MFSKENTRHLVYCDKEINEGKPILLKIGDLQPVALFGGCHHAALIPNKGHIIFINRFTIFDSKILCASLPNKEKATSVVCCKDLFFVLSDKGRVYTLQVNDINGSTFRCVNELIKYEVIWLSGTNEHCLAVTNNGRVFGYGSNRFCQLGIGESQKSTKYFKEILAVSSFKIKAAYAGAFHSLFQTYQGEVIACGDNSNGELFLANGPGGIVISPIKTMIESGAKFCIAGRCLSVVFIGQSPDNMPNMKKE